MSFFGLTALGSDSPFDCIKETPIHVFTELDFQKAFMEVAMPIYNPYSESEEIQLAAQNALTTATIHSQDITTTLQYLYKCPKDINNVPIFVYNLVQETYHSINSVPLDNLNLSQYLKLMKTVCEISETRETMEKKLSYTKQGLNTREYMSNLEYREVLAKHGRPEKGPREKNLLPITNNQDLGWIKSSIIEPRRAVKSCDETKFASAMVKAGLIYY